MFFRRVETAESREVGNRYSDLVADETPALLQRAVPQSSVVSRVRVPRRWFRNNQSQSPQAENVIYELRKTASVTLRRYEAWFGLDETKHAPDIGDPARQRELLKHRLIVR